MSRTIPLTKDKFALVSDEDYEYLINVGRWRASRQHYAVHYTTDTAGRQKLLYMHRLVAERVFGPLNGFQVDHISGAILGPQARLDNRRDNLRLATRSQNQAHKGPQINTRLAKGIHRRANRFEVKIRYCGQRFYLGRYVDLQTAWMVYAAAHRRLWNEFTTEADVPVTPEIEESVRALLCSQLPADGMGA